MATATRLVSSSSWALTLTLAGDEVYGQTLLPTHLNPSAVTYTSGTTPPISQYFAVEYTGDSGTPSWTINLASWTDVEGIAKDSTGLRVQELRLQADSSNAAVVTLEPGDSNPYALFGTAHHLDIPAGGMAHMRFNDKLADVATGAKNLKLTVGHGDVCTVELAIG